jgi:phosphonoacetaldehyde dehydrogenase
METPEYSCFVAGKKIQSSQKLTIKSPFDGKIVGYVSQTNRSHVEEAIVGGLSNTKKLSRYERYEIIEKTRKLLTERKEEFARTITSESGLCIRETRYEVGRAHDVLLFAAMECLKDDGQIFSCDISPTGKQRKIFTMREPLNLAVAITPFNHPLNQVAHKIIPAIAAGTPIILKPSTSF